MFSLLFVQIYRSVLMFNSSVTEKNQGTNCYSELANLVGVDCINPTTLLLCVKLIDEGVDPQQLAKFILRLKTEMGLN